MNSIDNPDLYLESASGAFLGHQYDDDDSPIYSIDDDDDENKEINPEEDEDYLYDDNDDEPEEEENDAEDDQHVKLPSPLWLMVKTLLTPVEGWKALKRARLSTDYFANRCFIPMVGLSTLSEIVKVFYEANITLGEMMLDALCTFLVFFFGYFTIMLVGSWMLPKKSKDLLKKEIGKQFVMLSLSTLALFWSAIQLVPMLDPILVFLPIWTIYIIFKGIRVIRVPSEVENSTTGILCIIIIAIPVLWNWLLHELLIPTAGI